MRRADGKRRRGEARQLLFGTVDLRYTNAGRLTPDALDGARVHVPSVRDAGTRR